MNRPLHRYNSLGQRIETLRSAFGSLADGRLTRIQSGSRGNWTSTIVQVRSDDHSDLSIGNGERRTIVYYDAL